MACQRVTEAVCFIHVLQDQHQADDTPYIDEFGGVAGQDRREANSQYL